MNRPSSVWLALAAVLMLPGITYAQKPPTPKIAEFFEDALIRYESGDSIGAALQLKNVLQAEPDHRPAHILLARVYLREGAAAAAEAQLIQARGLGADESLIVLPLAQAYLAQRKFQELITQIAYTGHPSSIACARIKGLPTSVSES